ncbi:hypothetical protein Patl1_35263 [Pistacia atlantica]|nr:hypothetical protein Patl1_35263 [Pistacia atlantica]
MSQKVYLDQAYLFTFSAWFQESEGEVPVFVAIKTATSPVTYCGSVVAKSNRWSMLKGGFTVNETGTADLYFECNNTEVEIWVDSVSLQPFSPYDWSYHQNKTAEKSRVRIQTVDDNGYPVVNVNVTIEQNPASRLPIGCATSKLILENEKYKQWFTSSFGLTTFANEMKWYNTEPSPDIENYSVPDSMLQLMKQNKILVHGHNIFTDDPKYLPSWFSWTASKSPAIGKRLSSIVSRYKGQLIGWDVVNENLHYSYFEEMMGENASGYIYKNASTPSKYIKKLKEIQSYIGKGSGMAIGLQSHVDVPNLPYMRAAIDTLALAGVPIWLTELDVPSGINQAEYLEQILKEAHSHPNVEGIILWAPWSLECYGGMCLTDRDFNNLPTGDVVDRLFCDYWSSKKLEGKTEKNGNFETSIFHGDYKVR